MSHTIHEVRFLVGCTLVVALPASIDVHYQAGGGASIGSSTGLKYREDEEHLLCAGDTLVLTLPSGDQLKAYVIDRA